MKLTIAHPTSQTPDSGTTEAVDYRPSGHSFVETTFDDVRRFYPEGGVLVVERKNSDSVHFDGLAYVAQGRDGGSGSS